MSLGAIGAKSADISKTSLDAFFNRVMWYQSASGNETELSKRVLSAEYRKVVSPMIEKISSSCADKKPHFWVAKGFPEPEARELSAKAIEVHNGIAGADLGFVCNVSPSSVVIASVELKDSKEIIVDGSPVGIPHGRVRKWTTKIPVTEFHQFAVAAVLAKDASKHGVRTPSEGKASIAIPGLSQPLQLELEYAGH